MVKKLKRLFYCDTYKELAEILGIRVDLLYLWNAKSKVPDSVLSLLKIIEKQQKEIQELRGKEEQEYQVNTEIDVLTIVKENLKKKQG